MVIKQFLQPALFMILMSSGLLYAMERPLQATLQAASDVELRHFNPDVISQQTLETAAVHGAGELSSAILPSLTETELKELRMHLIREIIETNQIAHVQQTQLYEEGFHPTAEERDAHLAKREKLEVESTEIIGNLLANLFKLQAQIAHKKAQPKTESAIDMQVSQLNPPPAPRHSNTSATSVIEQPTIPCSAQECAICYENISMQSNITLNCGHRGCCVTCLQRLFTDAEREHSFFVLCPVPNCREPLTFDDSDKITAAQTPKKPEPESVRKRKKRS